MVNNLCYGSDIIIHPNEYNQIKQENENLHQCYCSNKISYQSTWDGPAQIEQGTVIQIGCHKFLFYRHIVR